MHVLYFFCSSITCKGSKVAGSLPSKNCWDLSTDTVINEYIDEFKMAAEIVNLLKPKNDLLGFIYDWKLLL